MIQQSEGSTGLQATPLFNIHVNTFHFEKLYNPGKFEKNPDTKHMIKNDFIVFLIIISVVACLILFTLGSFILLYPITPWGFLVIIVLGPMLFILAGNKYPYWNYYLRIDDSSIKLRNVDNKMFPYYVPIRQFDFTTILNITYSMENNYTLFEQNNIFELMPMTGIEKENRDRIFDFLSKKENVKLKIKVPPIFEKALSLPPEINWENYKILRRDSSISKIYEKYY